MPDPQLPRIGFPEAEKTAKLSPDSLHDVVKTYFEAEYTSENWPFRQNGQPCLLPAKLVEEIMPLILRGQAADAQWPGMYVNMKADRDKLRANWQLLRDWASKTRSELPLGSGADLDFKWFLQKMDELAEATDGKP